jgi:hypothetical protein
MSKPHETAFAPVDQGKIMFLNPFSGEMEPFISDGETRKSLFEAAAKRINDLEEEVRRIKAHLVLD